MTQQTPYLVRHLSGEPIGRFPVWLMRQAGRYLPRYRAIRNQSSFWEMVTTPQLAIEVSLLPLEVAPVDGVIFFSDILTLPRGAGVPIEMQESVGPVVPTPLRSESEFRILADFDPKVHTPYVGETLANIRAKLAPEVALIGFAGAPWSVGCYLIEGRGKSQFSSVHNWLTGDQAGLARALSLLATATTRYLEYQIESGAQVLQLFDTWLCEMPQRFFEETYLPMLNTIFTPLRRHKVPLIYFSKHSERFLPHFQKLNVDVLSIDDSMTLTHAESLSAKQFSLQGNLPPECLLGSEAEVRTKTRALVEEAKRLTRPAILNLGHGVLPPTPVENVQAFVAEARTLWV